jgi:hypothetical protein
MKQLLPILSTLLGIRIDIVDESLNAEKPIEFKLEFDSKRNSHRDSHLQKQHRPIFSTLLGMQIVLRLDS